MADKTKPSRLEQDPADQNPADRGEATKGAPVILDQLIESGTQQLERPAGGLFLSALSAGLDISFGPLLVATVLALSPVDPDLGDRLILAVLYSIGFVIVILGRSELFTEHTTLATLPFLSGDASLARVGRLWGLVYSGNLIGALLFAMVAAPLGISLELFASEDLGGMASHLVEIGAWTLLGSAVMAGWLMGLVSWLVTASRDTAAQVLIIVLVAGSIGFLGLHHSIAGSSEVLLGVFGSDTTWLDWLRFLGLATLGNALGGVTFVALLKFGHVNNSD